MVRFIMALFAATLLFTSTARAEDAFHPSRVRLLVHGGLDLNEDARLEFRFIPAGNLIGELAPISYFGAKFKATDWLGIETYAGWAFKPDEPLVSLTLNPHIDNLWAWTEIDLRMPSYDGYWFAQLDYQILDWLHAGVEGEGWGNYESGSSWSHGGGPNLLFRFGKVGVDIAVHARELEDSVKPEFFMRAHLFL